ncbi:GlcG/HbpS family heme-binding protein [Chitinasiproducens palmae]|uniref:Uncharacterized conserved protein GlcG, DUF336 family n=1 Tax=Chitinasiproducens palmae TaxID=1770053 RepID=A0A1H2PKW4_9BURK|nr:heme-binding protein [Chitinasiproducens palmae]SDV47106.1 Uncharacterized conserved protein GlcG, DUF336 family [Chitinasiproducens palmae]
MSNNTIAMPSIGIAAAERLLDAAFHAASALGIETAVAVTDATGNLRAFRRGDGAPFLTVDVAINKAWTAASYGYPTHVWNDYVANPKVAPLANLPRMMPVGGGYAVVEAGHVIGGIGVSGGDYQQDQLVCEAALRETGFAVAAETAART